MFIIGRFLVLSVAVSLLARTIFRAFIDGYKSYSKNKESSHSSYVRERKFFWRFKRSSRRTQAEFIYQLSLWLDTLAMSMAGGMLVDAAIKDSSDVVHGRLKILLQRVQGRMVLGVSGVEALRLEIFAGTFANCPELPKVILALEQHQCLGLPLIARLQNLADEFRGTVAAQQTARMGRAVPISALVTAMVIAPACMVALGTALVGGLLIRSGMWTV